MRILTTVAGHPEKTWGRNTTLADPRCIPLLYGKMGTLERYFMALCVAFRMIRMRSGYDVAVIDGGPTGQWFSWLQSLLVFGRIPTLMIDCLWYKDPNRFIQFLKRLHKRLTALSVDRFLVWARHEILDYSREFNIPVRQFAYLPFHTTLDEYAFDVRDDGFVFAGGNGDRDYRVLVEAARGLEIPVFIATTDSGLLAGVAIPDNVTVKGVSPEEFRRLMATCRVAVLAMRGGLLHSGGQQTLLNSMALGKPTIVVGKRVADGYIEHGENGFAVEYNDSLALRTLLAELWDSPELRAKVGDSGKQYAAAMTTESFMARILEHARELGRSRKH
ncbi:MAG: glycosyltransferase [Acidobacteriota bacterium]